MINKDSQSRSEAYAPGKVWRLNPEYKRVTDQFVEELTELDKKVFMGQGEFEPPPLDPNDVAESMARSDNFFYGVFNGDRKSLDAYLWLQLKPKSVYVYALGIDTKLQGVGYGAQFLDLTNNIASLHGKSKVNLDVDPTHANALSLYVQRDFVPRRIKMYGDVTDIPRLHLEKDTTKRQMDDPYMQVVIPLHEIDAMRSFLNEEDINYLGAAVLRDPRSTKAALALNVDMFEEKKARNARKKLYRSKTKMLIAPPVLQAKNSATKADALTKKQASTRFTVGSESLHSGSAMGLKGLLEKHAIYPSFPRLNMDYDVDTKAVVDAFVHNRPVVVGPLLFDANSVPRMHDDTSTNKIDTYLNENIKNECTIAAFFRDLKTFAPSITPAALVYEHFEEVLPEPYFRPLSDASIIARHESLLRNFVIDTADKPGRDFYMTRTADQEKYVNSLVDALQQSQAGIIKEDPIYHSITFIPHDDVLATCSEKDREVLKDGVALRRVFGTPSNAAWGVSHYMALSDGSSQISIRDVQYDKNYPAEMRLLKKVLALDNLHTISFDSAHIGTNIVKQCIAGAFLDEVDKIV